VEPFFSSYNDFQKRKDLLVETHKRILLYGNSLILESIGDSLRRCPQLEVTTLLPPAEEREQFDSLKPDILLFDLGTTRPEAVFPLLGSDQNLQVIGISPDVNLVKVWSIRELHEVSLGDLLAVITTEAKDPPFGSNGDGVQPC
jgi:hypothetical protein